MSYHLVKKKIKRGPVSYPLIILDISLTTSSIDFFLVYFLIFIMQYGFVSEKRR